MPALEHDASDCAVVEAQLGRPLRGEWAVAHRCHLGVPTVIENHPLIQGRPFPTLFWLTCPVLVKRISRQEAGGAMARISERLGGDPALRARLQEAIERLRARRDHLAPLPASTATPGGGPTKVKCLHAHTAQELSDPPNPVGALALAEAGFPDCVLPCVREAR